MNLKKIILSDASTDAKLSAIAYVLQKELPKLIEKVDTVKKLKGEQGDRGLQGDKGDKGDRGEKGADGRDGKDGKDGKNGKDGSDGISIVNAKIDFDGSLVLKLSDGRELNVGEVVVPDLAERIKVITNGGGTSQSVLDTLASLQSQIDNLLPSQTGNAGKYLKTNGTTLSWSSVTGGGGLNYQGTWNASTNTPTLASGVGSNSDYYVVSVAGSTNLNGITDWQVGDWAIFNGTAWQKIDQTNLVVSVNGQTGAVTLTTTDITEGTNQYFTTARARSSVSAGTGITYSSSTGVITNASPDQTVALTGAGTTSISGTYPNFTITSNDQYVGTVTSVTGTSPVASSGGATPAISLASGYGDTQNPYASKTANYVLAAPNGTAGVPTFRAIVAADIPTLNQNTTGTASNVTGTVAIANGGTGATTRQDAMDALAGATTSGQYLRGNGTDVVMSAIQAADVPTLNQNTTGTASNVTGTVAVANGGTGQTTYTNGQLLIGNTTGNTLAKATLTQGNGVAITNGAGTITIASALAKTTTVVTSGSAQTYTAPANTQWVKVTVVGPGGNGGAANNQRATGGGGGGVAIKWLAMSAAQTLTYTVGTASGTASSVSSGTLVITTITANSGSNGTGTAYANSITAGGAGGTASGGDINITGGQGGYSYGSSTTVGTNFSGKGGDCPGFGSGGAALAIVATAGVAGNGYGAGGGGAHGSNTAANGTGGIIIFEAY